MKNILIINSHPDQESFNYAIANTFEASSRAAGYEVKRINVGELDFDPNLAYGYRKPTPLEEDLKQAQEMILWAEHIVWIYPVWWGGLPAITKGFIDRVFLPGFSFGFNDKAELQRLLIGRTAEIISTMDAPFEGFLKLGELPTQVMKELVLEFNGIAHQRTTYFGPIMVSSPEQREVWLKDIEALAKDL